MSIDQTKIRAQIQLAANRTREARDSHGHTLMGYAYAIMGRNQALDSISSQVSSMPADNGMRVACRAGCSHCCHQLIAVTPLEVLILATMIRETWDQTDISRLVVRLENLATLPATVEGRRSRNLPCPLLKDDKCSVYEWRPAVCRSFLSYDVTACKTSLDEETATGDSKTEIPSSAPAGEIAAVLGIGVDIALHDRKLDTEKVDLARGLLMALNDTVLLDRWLNSEHVFDEARITFPKTNKQIVQQAQKTHAVR